jgi:hypothetical protein
LYSAAQNSADCFITHTASLLSHEVIIAPSRADGEAKRQLEPPFHGWTWSIFDPFP